MQTDVQRATTDLRQHPHAQFFRDNPTFEPVSAGPIGPAGVMARLGPEPSTESAPDLVNHPPHYTSDPSGVECIQITRHRNFNVGNAIKYLWRNGLKESGSLAGHAKQIEDLKKAVFYINDEISRLEATR